MFGNVRGLSCELRTQEYLTLEHLVQQPSCQEIHDSQRELQSFPLMRSRNFLSYQFHLIMVKIFEKPVITVKGERIHPHRPLENSHLSLVIHEASSFHPSHSHHDFYKLTLCFSSLDPFFRLMDCKLSFLLPFSLRDLLFFSLNIFLISWLSRMLSLPPSSSPILPPTKFDIFFLGR